jgi:hypothetical protein
MTKSLFEYHDLDKSGGIDKKELFNFLFEVST